MTQRRMFTDKITESDAFLDMPLTTQALYFHLCMNADDDGFVNRPKKIQRMIGASDDDLKLLLAKRFALAFDSGIIVIKHWRMHNLIRKDRYKETDYTEEKATLELKENGAYTESVDRRLPNGCQTVAVGKDSIGKDNKEKLLLRSSKEKEQIPPTVEDVKAYCEERNNGIDAEYFIDYYTARNWILTNGKKMKDWRAAVRTWEHRKKERENDNVGANGKSAGRNESVKKSEKDYLRGWGSTS